MRTNYFTKYLFLIIALFVLIFFSYHSQNFKLDASSDTLILQNDSDFKFFNFYNKVFVNKNFLVLAVQSDKIIDNEYLKIIEKIKAKLSTIDNIESTFAIVDAPVLISNNLRLQDLSSYEIATIKNTNINFNLVLNEFANSPIFKDQIISKNKKVSSIIIYPKNNNEFNSIKKKRNEALLAENKDKDKIKILNEKYFFEKEKANVERHELIKNIRTSLNQLNIPYHYYLGGIDMIADDTISFVKKDILVFSLTVSLFLILILFVIFRDLKWVIIPLVTTFYSIIIMTG